MQPQYDDSAIRDQLLELKRVVDDALEQEERGPRRALLASLQDSLRSSVGASGRLADNDFTTA